MYEIKQTPEDFIVEEIPAFKSSENGQFSYFKLWKRNLNTINAVSIIAEKLHIPEKRIKFAGNKDKQAETTQYISIEGQIKNEINEHNLKLTFECFGDEPISLGNLKGNKFTIKVITDQPLKEQEKFINYFGEQRLSKNNAVIGKLLVQRKFKEAAQGAWIPACAGMTSRWRRAG